jgi:cell wall-associated NlpC family hydrolase
MRWLLSSSITLSLATGAVVSVAEESIVANDTAIGIIASQAVEKEPEFLSGDYIVQMLEEQKAEKEKALANVYSGYHANLADNEIAMEERIRLLEKQIGKTWYVFAGSTPQGWDCSGMVRWFYQGLGVELWHGASAQKNAGTKVDEPKRGDIVSFGHNGDTAGHVGIYIAKDVMLHAGGKRGQKTSYRSISEFGKFYGEIAYTRILNTK